MLEQGLLSLDCPTSLPPKSVKTEVSKLGFQPSVQQLAYYLALENDTRSITLEAVAGSGKTTTIIGGLPRMRGTALVTAFNVDIVKEMKRRVGHNPNVRVCTLHSAGLAAWTKIAPKVVVEKRKCAIIYDTEVGQSFDVFRASVLDLVGYAKQAGLVPDSDDAQWENIITHFDVEVLDQTSLVIGLAKELLARSNKQGTKVIDYDDMLYLPLIYKVALPQYDWVVIDEAQDTNKARRELALRMLKPGGRFIAVGDRHQAIYAFAGADSDSLDQITSATKAVCLPLSVSYRCPRQVVAVAQQYVPHIQAAPSAPEGTVEDATYKEFLRDVQVGDAVLCRYNKPIVEAAHRLLAQGIPVRIEGRSFQGSLKTLVRRWKSHSFDDLICNLEAYRERETQKHRAKGDEDQVELLHDKLASLMVFVRRAMDKYPAGCPAQAVCAEIDSIFSGHNQQTVVFSSIHKAKGLEFNKVFWFQTRPSRRAKADWELAQEKNLCYVAATRAKETLILVTLPD